MDTQLIELVQKYIIGAQDRITAWDHYYAWEDQKEKHTQEQQDA